MNKMTKGALATGLGVALLLGGGGTLAVWNDAATAQAGTIAAGNLDVEAKGGKWFVDGVELTTEQWAAYKIVPGQKLTYQQDLAVDLKGDKMQAELKVDGFQSLLQGDLAKNMTVDRFDVKFASETAARDLKTSYRTGTADPLVPTDSGAATVTVEVTFPSTVTGQNGAAKSLDLSAVKFQLEQIAPTATN